MSVFRSLSVGLWPFRTIPQYGYTIVFYHGTYDNIRYNHQSRNGNANIIGCLIGNSIPHGLMAILQYRRFTQALTCLDHGRYTVGISWGIQWHLHIYIYTEINAFHCPLWPFAFPTTRPRDIDSGPVHAHAASQGGPHVRLPRGLGHSPGKCAEIVWNIWENLGIPPAKCWFHPNSISVFATKTVRWGLLKSMSAVILLLLLLHLVRRRRTSTASSGRTVRARDQIEWSPPSLNYKESPKIYQIECKKECQKICQIECQKECQNICQKVWGMMSE